MRQPDARRRDRLDIILDILSRCRRGAKKTQVVYGCNLNFNVFRRYFKEMRDSNLLEDRNGVIKTTLKGIRCLQWFKDGKLEFGLL